MKLKGYKAITRELAGKALNIPEGELPEFVTKPDSGEDLTEDQTQELFTFLDTRYRNVISSINKNAGIEADKKKDEFVKTGMRTRAKEFEKYLREKFAITSDKEGEALIDEIAGTIAASKKTDKLTDAEIQATPVFIRTVEAHKKALSDLEKAKNDELEAFKSETAKKELFSSVSGEALTIFEGLKPVLSSDPKKAQAQKQLVLDRLKDYDFEQVDGKFYPKKDGVRLKNAHGHETTFDGLVKEVAESFFDFQTAESRESANGADGNKGSNNGASGASGGKGYVYTGAVPKTAEEYNTMLGDRTKPIEERRAITALWEKANPQQN